MNGRNLSALAAAAGLLSLAAWSPRAHAVAKIQVGDDKEFGVGFLLQPQFRFDLDGSADGTPSYDPYIRRARILFTAKIGDKLKFFAETDNPNFGKESNWASTTFIQDAFVEYDLDPALRVDLGMLLVPFSHHFYQGATSLLSLDYHSGLAKYPAGSNKVWRDAGVMLRGSVADEKLEYRLALLNGVESGYGMPTDLDEGATAPDPLNSADVPRVVGRLVYNVFGSDTGPGAAGFYADGIYIKRDGKHIVNTKKMLSFGASVDYQPGAVYDGSGKPANVLDAAGDVFWDLPVSDTQSVNGQLDFYYYDQGEDSPTTGMGLFGEAGYRIDFWQPVLSFEWFDVAGDGDEQAGDYVAAYAGLNYWYWGHNANVKLQLGGSQVHDGDTSTDDPFSLAGLVQTQFLF